MFINKNGMVLLNNLSMLKDNKKIAINEFLEWEVPLIPDIELSIVSVINKAFESGTIDMRWYGKTTAMTLENILHTLKLHIEIGQNAIDEIIDDDYITLKYNDYANKFYLACDNIKRKII